MKGRCRVLTVRHSYGICCTGGKAGRKSEGLLQIVYISIDLFMLLSCSGEWLGYFPGNITDGLREEAKLSTGAKF